jgi:hypothetical protein
MLMMMKLMGEMKGMLSRLVRESREGADMEGERERSHLALNSGCNKTFESGTSVRLFLISTLKTADGLLLFILSVIFLIIAFVPYIIEQTIGIHCSQFDLEKMTTAFLLMPLALIAEYLWFSVGKPIGKTSALRFFVLLATAFIPFLKPCLG